MDEREIFCVKRIFQLLSALHFISAVNGLLWKDINILLRTELYHYYSDHAIIPLMSKKFSPYRFFSPTNICMICMIYPIDKYSCNSWFALEKKATISLFVKCPDLMVEVVHIWYFPAVVICCRKTISSLRGREVFLPIFCLISDAPSLLKTMIISEREGKNFFMYNPWFFC